MNALHFMMKINLMSPPHNKGLIKPHSHTSDRGTSSSSADELSNNKLHVLYLVTDPQQSLNTCTCTYSPQTCLSRLYDEVFMYTITIPCGFPNSVSMALAIEESMY